MSRAAALDARKGEQKAALAAKAAEHAADLAMGLTATMAKIIKQDELICTVCGATKLGPITKCECAGGRSKPGEELELIRSGVCLDRQLQGAIPPCTHVHGTGHGPALKH